MKSEDQCLRTIDNNRGKQVESNIIPELSLLANKKIKDLVSEAGSSLLIFPNDFDQYGDDIGSQEVFSLHNTCLTTGNIMGFIGIKDTQVTIQSRFSKEKNDYFLHYMLQKVLSINMFDLKHGFDKQSIFDFLIYLFPYYLKRALSQGLYKEYHKNEYNDANLHGVIDIKRHLTKNLPFADKIAYKTREHSYDNKVTQLIRHTIEYIRSHEVANKIIHADAEVQNCVSQITQSTTKYSHQDRRTIINKNLRSVSHPWFTEYTHLQRLCLRILRFEEVKYGYEDDEIYGLLFDGAWLWEEYLNTILVKTGFKHPKNKTNQGGIWLFSEHKYKRYPDFWKDNIILDAKYKRISNDEDKESIERHDIHQLISYMYVKKAAFGGIIYPKANTLTILRETGYLNGYGGKVFTVPFSVPQSAESYTDFCNQILYSEIALIAEVNKELNLLN
jgi:5-methylcytosine-specific restriction endonuclease McrBC regulatory subunit McrC